MNIKDIIHGTIDYIKIVTLSTGWRELFNQYNIDYILIEHYAPLAQMLMSNEKYKLVYDDENFSVLVKNSLKFQKIINTYERDWVENGTK